MANNKILIILIVRKTKMNNRYYFVYILTNKKNGTLYVGITNNLKRRVYEHKKELVEGFTKKYNLDKLVYYEVYSDPKEAILREKRIKSWNRSWKIRLINKKNFRWEDLYYKI